MNQGDLANVEPVTFVHHHNSCAAIVKPFILGFEFIARGLTMVDELARRFCQWICN